MVECIRFNPKCKGRKKKKNRQGLGGKRFHEYKVLAFEVTLLICHTTNMKSMKPTGLQGLYLKMDKGIDYGELENSSSGKYRLP